MDACTSHSICFDRTAEASGDVGGVRMHGPLLRLLDRVRTIGDGTADDLARFYPSFVSSAINPSDNDSPLPFHIMLNPHHSAGSSFGRFT